MGVCARFSPHVRKVGTLLRKFLIGVAALLVVLVAGLVILKVQADKAAGDWGDGVRANLAKYEQIYAADRKLVAIQKLAGQIGEEMPADLPKVEKAARIGPALGALYALNTPILRREITDTPALASVPLGDRLSKRYREAEKQQRILMADYRRGLQVSVDAAAFYPRISRATDRTNRIVIAAPLKALTSKALSTLRDVQTELFGGDAGKDQIAAIDQRLADDAGNRWVFVRTPMPPSFRARKDGILAIIERRRVAGEAAKQAILDKDLAAWRKAAPVFNANAEAVYVKAYLLMFNDAVNLHEQFARLGKKIQAQSETL